MKKAPMYNVAIIKRAKITNSLLCSGCLCVVIGFKYANSEAYKCSELLNETSMT